MASLVLSCLQSSTRRFQIVYWDFSLSMSADISLTNRSEYALLLLSIVWFTSCNIYQYKVKYMYDIVICMYLQIFKQYIGKM